MTTPDRTPSSEPAKAAVFEKFPASVQRLFARCAVVTLPQAADVVARLQETPEQVSDAGIAAADLEEAARLVSEALPVEAAPPSRYAGIPSGVPIPPEPGPETEEPDTLQEAQTPDPDKEAL